MAVLKAVNEGLFDELPLDSIGAAEAAVQERVIETLPDLFERMESGDKLDEPGWQQVLDVVANAVAGLENRD